MAVSYKKLFKLLIDRNMRRKDLRELTGISYSTLSKLTNGDNVNMEVVEKLCLALNCKIEETGKTGVHTRRVGLDRDTNKELLLRHIRQNNAVGTPFKELQQVLPGHNRNQIQVLMRELKEDEKVVCKGKTRAAKWYIVE